MRTKHFMLDVETLGRGPFAPIISLGAVHFNPNIVEGPIISAFYVTICPIESEKRGFRVEADTAMWWMQPDQREAWDLWTKELHFAPDDALNGFSQWLDHLDTMDPPYDGDFDEERPLRHRAIWGNGPRFDNLLVGNHYRLLNMPEPWDYGGDRCFRTFRNLPRAASVKPPGSGVPHKADDDALFQATWLTRILNEYQITV